MRLLDLEPQFVRYATDGSTERYVHVDKLSDADGIYFGCPKCFMTSGHRILCWFEGRVADDIKPGPGRWLPRGEGYHDLSFVPHVKSHSVALQGGCSAHFTLTNGEIHGA